MQAQPRFEVARLRLSPPPESDLININLGAFRNGRLTMNNVTLADAVKFAWELSSDAQLKVPDWNREVRFDLEAIASPDTSPEALHRMTQALLTERLHLKLRTEQRVLPHLALVTAKTGAKIQRPKPDAVNSAPQLPGKIHHPRMPMSLLAQLLSRFERQTVANQTGLEGEFEVNLEWAPDNMMPVNPDAAPPDRPSLFRAVEEQLGLKLESRRAPLDVLVVEDASRVPDEN